MAQEGLKRKLTAIISADAVGYSLLKGDDEAATVKQEVYRILMLLARLKAIIGFSSEN